MSSIFWMSSQNQMACIQSTSNPMANLLCVRISYLVSSLSLSLSLSLCLCVMQLTFLPFSFSGYPWCSWG